MKKTRILPLLLIPVFLLGACSLIPAQEISDPLRIDNATMTVTFGAGNAAALVPLTVTGTGETTIEEFNNSDESFPVSPARLEVQAGLAASATLLANDGPVEIVLNNIVMTVRLWEGAATYEAAASDDRVEAEASYDGSLRLIRGTCGTVSCPYSFTDENLALTSFELILTGSDLGRAFRILGEGSQPNRVQALLSLQATGNPSDPVGTMTFTIEAATGQVSF